MPKHQAPSTRDLVDQDVGVLWPALLAQVAQQKHMGQVCHLGYTDSSGENQDRQSSLEVEEGAHGEVQQAFQVP